MSVTAVEIINELEKKYPSQYGVTINHLADKQLGAHKETVNQYIFGVTAPDPLSGSSFERYKDRVDSDLKATHGSLEFMAWTFDDYEVEDLKTTLQDLTTHYKVEVDIDWLLSKAGLKGTPTGQHFLLVVAINQIKIVKAVGR